MGDFCAHCGYGMYVQGNFATAFKYAQELVRFGEDSNDLQNWCWGLALTGMAQRGLGRIEEASNNLRKAIELAAEVPDHTCYVHPALFWRIVSCYMVILKDPWLC